MRGFVRTIFLVGIGAALAGSGYADSSGNPVEESWESAQMDGASVGFVHTTVRRLEAEDGKLLRTSVELELTFKRNNALLRLRREHGTEETSDGKVVGVFMQQGQEGGKQLVLSGTLEDGRMHVRIDNGRIDRRLAWSDEIVGLHGLEQRFRERKPKPGDSWKVKRYDPTYNAVVTLHVAVKEREDIALTTGTPRVKLLRVELTAEPLEAPGIKVQPPPEVWWLNDDYLAVRRQFELEGLGAVSLTRTTRQAATASPTASRSLDIGLKSLVPLNRRLERPYTTRSVVYRIVLRGDRDPASALVHDEHQDIRAVRGDTFELHVHPHRLEHRADSASAKSEYVESCHYIDCADARVKELARRASGDEKDLWAKAKRIERWVKQNMRVDRTEEMGPASVAARRLRGDCRQFALLTTALCRAEGIPARTAIGLLYVEKARRPMMGFHMWTEVFIEGQWLGLDATLGLGGVSAAHLKISDHSWHDTQSLTPLLPVHRVLGKMTIAVVSDENQP